MKVVGINGSPRKKGNTSILINLVFKELEQEGIETEFVQLGGRQIRGCVACYKCFANKDCRCSNDKDELNEILAKHTSKPLPEIEKDTDRNYFMSAKEAKDYGIVDEVIDKRSAADEGRTARK